MNPNLHPRGSGLGPGPRAGLMTAIAARGHRLWVVRTVLELAALAAGFVLGGTIGVGTVLFAFGIGPAMQWGMRVCGVNEAKTPSTAEA